MRAGFYFFCRKNIILHNARFMLHIDFLPNESIVQLKQTKQCTVESKCRWSETEFSAEKTFLVHGLASVRTLFAVRRKL